MFKKIIKIIFTTILFLNFLTSFALSNATISLDKEKYDINEAINLKISIQSEGGGDIEISDLKGLDNFTILGKSQSSSTQIEVINGKTGTALSNILNLQLQAKQNGSYEIGPATIKEGKKEIQTNSIKIEVSGDKLFINNSANNIGNIQNPIGTSPPSVNSSNNNDEIENIQASVEKKDFNNNTLYLFLIILVLAGGGLIFILKNNPEVLKNLNSKKKKEEEIDKIYRKYNIKNIQNMTYDEILNYINTDEKEILEPIIKLIIKAKYSNIVSDNNKLYNLIKEI